MGNKITIEDKKVKTQKFRVSFPKLDKPHSYKGKDPKYELTMLFDKEIDLAAPVSDKAGKVISISMKKAVHNAIVEKYGEDKTKWPTRRTKKGKVVSAIHRPFRDGDLEKPDMDGYKNSIFVKATAKEANPPGVVDKDRERIDAKELYAGCYARASLIAFCYEVEGKIGVSFALQNIQKLGEGKKFSGKKNAEDEFDSVDDESDDEANYESDEDSETTDDDDGMGF